VAGIAEPLGELTGYGAGYAGRAVIRKNEVYLRMVSWMRRHGSLTIFVRSAVTNVLFDLAGIAAGALRFPLWKFLLFCWAGKTIKSFYVAMLGYWGIEWVQHLLQRLF
jgi:membrane protein DedA with SNARE-associated domain